MNKNLDIYYDKDKNKNKNIIIYIHGGAWMIRSDIHNQRICETLKNECEALVLSVFYDVSICRDSIKDLIYFTTALASLIIYNNPKLVVLIGFLIIVIILVIAYFLHSESIWPKQLHDVLNSLNWIRKNHKYFGLSLDNIYLIGHSAGAHIASLVPYYTDLKIKGIVCISGVFSDCRLEQTFLGARLLKQVFPKERKKYFPIYFVNDDKTPKKYLIINASQDITLKRHSLDFYFSLKENGIHNVEWVLINNEDHFSIIHKNGFNKIKNKIKAFVNDT